MAEEFERWLDLYLKFKDAVSVPEWLLQIAEFLMGFLLLASLVVAVWKVLNRQPFIGLFGLTRKAIDRIPPELNRALSDPIEHRFLKHAIFQINVIFACLGFLTFFVWAVLSGGLFAFAQPPLTGFKPLLAGGFVSLLGLGAMFFKAEAGRALVEYRVWRRRSKSPTLEMAVLNVIGGKCQEFEKAFSQAERLVMATPGYISHSLTKCVEEKGQYLLLIEWQALEDHIEGFRKSKAYEEWSHLLHHFYDPFPVVHHYVALGARAA